MQELARKSASLSCSEDLFLSLPCYPVYDERKGGSLSVIR